jgi:hypothetical protein
MFKGDVIICVCVSHTHTHTQNIQVWNFEPNFHVKNHLFHNQMFHNLENLITSFTFPLSI